MSDRRGITLQEDPRWTEHRAALHDVRDGLNAPAGAYERYRDTLPGYLTLLAEQTPAVARLAMMQALLDGDERIPLGAILAAFKASEQEAGALRDRPPVVIEQQDAVERLRALPYGRYLSTPHWRSVRSEALKRAGERCQLCNSPELLEVHHRTYERIGAERPSDVIVLCARCHSRHHSKPRQAA